MLIIRAEKNEPVNAKQSFNNQSKFTAKGVEWIAGEYAKHKINKQIGGEL